jgi:DNA polymerase-3 subunit epsilon
MPSSSNKTSLDQQEFVCLDCETTGLDPQNDRVIEVAITVFKGTEILESYETLVNPQQPIPEESRKIHGIKDSMVAEKPLINEILPEVFKLIGTRPIVGHCIEFDLTILKEEAKRIYHPWDFDHNIRVDTLRLARLYGGSPVNSLERLRQHFNIAEETAHRAMGDVLVNIQVFRKLTSNFKTLHDVLQELSRPIEMKMMPLGKHKGRPLKEIPLDYLQWAARKDFDQDLLFSLKQELKRRRQGHSFNQSANPFLSL